MTARKEERCDPATTRGTHQYHKNNLSVPERKRYFKRLRQVMKKEHYTVKQLAEEVLGISESAVVARFTRRRPWTLAEMYKILTFFDLPWSELPLYFPPVELDYEGVV